MKRIIIANLFGSLCLMASAECEMPDTLSGEDVAAVLDEVTVKGYQRYVTIDGPVTTVRIQGSAFEHIGSVSKLLPNIPGLAVVNGKLTVIGAGTPVIILDGREINNDDELAMLQSNNIKEVKIDKNPGGIYSSTAPAAVYITTRKSARDYLYLDISNDLTRRRKWNETPSLNLRATYGGFTSTLSYSYGYGEGYNKETYFRTIDHDDNPARLFNLEQSRRYEFRSPADHSVRWMGEYLFNKAHRIGVYYYMDHSPYITHETGETRATTGDSTEAAAFDETNHSRSDLNNFTLLYVFSKGRHGLQISQDAAFRRTSNSRATLEGRDTPNIITSDGKSRYDAYTTNLRYSLDLPWKLSLGLGGKYNYVNSRSTLISAGNTDYQVPASNVVYVVEQNPQAYLWLFRTFGNVSVYPGIRYEYTYRHIDNHSTDSPESTVKEKYSGLFPWITVSYRNSHGFFASANYMRSRIQPRFAQLNSGLVYHDPYSYADGNPDLRSTINDRLQLRASFKNVELGVSYRHSRDEIADVETPVTPESNIVRQYSINIHSHDIVTFSLSYALNIRNFSGYAQAELVLPNSVIPVGDAMVRRDMPSFNAAFNLSYQPCSWLSIYTNYNHQGRREDLMTTQRAVNCWNIGVSGSFLNDRLTVDISASDIFHGANYNNLTNHYTNVTWGTFGTNDSRGVSLTLTYVIFDKQINGRTRPGNDDILNRIR